MSRIAIAGGAGGVGKTIVEALSQTKHKVFILSRSERHSDNPNITYAKVDYDDVNSMTSLFETNNIDTVISTITMLSKEASIAQLNLIAAAEKSTVTRRLIPSEFGAVVNEEVAKLDPYANFWIENAEALKKTTLQHTRLAVGFFMDYWGMPRLDTVMAPFKWAVDVENGIAAIPGTGDEKLSVTYTRDLAKFVVRLLDEADWPERAAVIGQDITFNQLLGWAEAATGKKFKVSYDSIEKLEKGEPTPLFEGMAESAELMGLAAVFGAMTVKGYILVEDDKGYRLNERFPELKMLTAEEMIRKTWGNGA